MRLRHLSNKAIAVWGLGLEGQAALRHLPQLAGPASITGVTDGNRGAAATLAAADAVVKSPGISRHRPDVAALANAGRLTSGTNLFLAETGGEGVVGVTGSKGKSTTSSLIAHLLRATGEDVELGGNIGRAPLELLTLLRPGGNRPGNREASQVTIEPFAGRFVVELSSYQCADAEDSPEVGVLTALFPEHLDWHGSVEAYIADKCNLFAHRRDAITIVDTTNPLVATVLDRLPGPAPFGLPGGIHVDDEMIVRRGRRVLFPLSASPLRGAHNASNLCAALTVLDVLGRDPAVAEGALASFQPLPHRLEVVGEVGGRLVMDDGMSTAPAATIAAVDSFPGRFVTLLVGGHDRGLDLAELVLALSVRSEPTLVVTMPPSGDRLAEELAQQLARPITRALVDPTAGIVGPTGVGAVADLTMKGSGAVAGLGTTETVVTDGLGAAVSVALARTPPGGVILLSPAAPSFGAFRDYKERSAAFRRLTGTTPPAASTPTTNC